MSSNLSEMYERERNKWDRLTAPLLENPAQLKLEPGEDFHTVAQNSTVMIGVSEFLGDLYGKRALELGCGTGKMSALLARAGAQVTSFDLSAMSVHVARTRAEVNGLADAVRLVVAAGERLPFANNSFDVVFGRAILHHLDVNLGAGEPLRVLKPGGKAVFVEPLGMNPVLSFVRDHIPYPNKNPVGDDQPLHYKQVEQWGRGYSYFSYQEVQLLGMLERAFPYRFKVRLWPLHRLDQILLERFPALRRYSRYIVMKMQK